MKIQRFQKPHKAAVDESVFANSLSALGICTTGDYAYLKLNLESQSLESIQGIQNYPHLQHINLSKNKLTTLKPLSSINHHLTHNVSNNSLTHLLDFAPPANLLYVDASNNHIKHFGKVSKNQYLQRLILDNNIIEEIIDIEELPNLQYLSLNSNQISQIISLPVSIQYLNLGRNEILKIKAGLQKLVFLRVLDLSYNKLASLRGLEGLESLMVLKLEGNLIQKTNTLDHLANLALLSDINLKENFICDKQHYRLRIAYKLPQLRTLDGEILTAEEKIKAENLYGLDIEDRKALFNQIFPGQLFIDRRLVTSEMLDIESESEEDEGYITSKNSNTDSKLASRILSKVGSRDNIDSAAMAEILAFSKRYVGDMIEREEENRKSRVAFEEQP